MSHKVVTLIRAQFLTSFDIIVQNDIFMGCQTSMSVDQGIWVDNAFNAGDNCYIT